MNGSLDLMALNPEDVHERLTFAEKRLDELLALNSGDLPGADSSYRQQLVQEFFFHLVGATEVLAQLINEERALGLDSEAVSIPAVSQHLPTSDPLASKLSSLHTRVKGRPLPQDPYSDQAYIFRILNYRHHVTHRQRNPFLFRVGSSPPASFFVDPREPTSTRVPSARSAQDEMRYMLELVLSRCQDTIAAL